MIEYIRDRARYYNCPVCGRNLRGCEVTMLNHQEDRFTVRVTCAACHVSFIVVLAIQTAGVEAVMDEDDEIVIEDVSQATPARPGPGPIEADEILDLHLLLRDFQGSFDDLIKQPNRSG
jgi:transcription elongation factor Elf1